MSIRSLNEPTNTIWEVRWDEYSATGERKRKFKKFTNCSRRKVEKFEAERVAEQEAIKRRVAAGETVVVDVTVGALLDEWYESRKAAGKSPSTLRRYKQIIDGHLKPAFGSLLVKKLTPHLLLSQYAVWGERLSPSSVRDHHETLRTALRWGVRMKRVASVVTDGITSDDLPKAADAQPHPLTLEEQAQLLDFAPIGGLTNEPWFRVALLCAIHTGARRGELLALRWSDIRDGWINIVRSVNETSGTYKAPKNGKGRKVPVSKRLAESLASLKAHQEAKELDRGNDLVFRRPDGSPVGLANFSHTVAELMRGVFGAATIHTLHDLRDTFATNVARASGLHAASKLLGHADYSITAKRYAGLLEDDAVAAIAKAFAA